MKGPVRDIFALALNLYRAPLQYRPFVGKDKPVPSGFPDFLDVLSKRDGHAVWNEFNDIQGATIQELREAGFFLVKRILFVEGANYYRLFGLDSSATTQEIRERYRLLIGLFHPDKMPFGDEWSELYAPKINDAYNILKNPDKRRHYDEGIGLHPPAIERQSGPEPMYWGDAGKEPGSAQVFQGREDHVSPVADSPFHAASREPSGQDAETISSDTVAESSASGSAVHTWKLLLGLLILSGAGISLWYLLPVEETLSSAAKSPVPEVARAIPIVPEATPVPSATASKQGSKPTALADKGTKSVQITASEPPEKTLTQTESRPESKLETQAFETLPPARVEKDLKTSPAIAKNPEPLEKPVFRQPHQPAPNPGPSRAVAVEPEAQSLQVSPEPVVPVPSETMPEAERPSHAVANNKQPQDIEPVTNGQTSAGASGQSRGVERSALKAAGKETGRVKKFPEDRIRQADIDYLLYRFVHSYQEGAIEDFTALFDVDALTNDGIGRNHIVTSYGDLFGSSSTRSIRIRDVLWTSKDPMRADIDFQVELRVENNPFLGTSRYGGKADMRVELGNKGLLITEFLHQVTPR